MIHLFSPRQPYPEISFIGLAIQGNKDQRHVGILFRTDKSQTPRLLHLAFHQRLICETPPYRDLDKYYWLHCPGFDDNEQLQLAVWFEKVFLVNGKNIPYGLAYGSTGYFDSNGGFIKSEKNCGLTCATFIMALFEGFDFPLINIESWVHREDDAIWQNSIIKNMEEDQKKNPHMYSKSHIRDQCSNIGIASRFRPEEVAASANLFVDDPLEFNIIEQNGQELIRKMGICR